MARWSATRHRVRQSNSDPCRKSLLFHEKRAAGNGLRLEAVQTVYSRLQDGRRSDLLETSERASGAASPMVGLHRAVHAELTTYSTVKAPHTTTQTRCRADRVRGKATRVGSVLVAWTTERTLRRQGRAFRPKISCHRDRKCRETFPRKPHRRGPSLPVHVIASNYARRLPKIEPEWMTPRRLPPPASGRREPSGVHRDRRDGYRPTGAGRASPEASEVDLGHSEHVRPGRTGSDRIGPEQT